MITGGALGILKGTPMTFITIVVVINLVLLAYQVGTS